jgi:hypothetical protein
LGLFFTFAGLVKFSPLFLLFLSDVCGGLGILKFSVVLFEPAAISRFLFCPVLLIFYAPLFFLGAPVKAFLKLLLLNEALLSVVAP